MRPPTPVPTPEATPVPSVTATPTPITNLTPAEVKLLVFQMINNCANQVSEERAAAVVVDVTVLGLEDGQRWLTEATGDEGAMTFGSWQVVDATGEVTPSNELANRIVSLVVSCADPVAVLSGGSGPAPAPGGYARAHTDSDSNPHPDSYSDRDAASHADLDPGASPYSASVVEHCGAG